MIDESTNSDCFYSQTIARLKALHLLSPESRILVVCGSYLDRDVLLDAGFASVVISNLDSRMVGDEFSPFEWSYQNAESLSFEDEEFDFVLVHSGLHHCHSPHRALLEMYRVARKGVLLFEPYDNLLTRLGVKLNFGQQYEHAAVFYNDCKFGGVNNSEIPNYVYRFSKAEIEKSILTFDPLAKSKFHYFFRMAIPWKQIEGRKKPGLAILVRLMYPVMKLVEFVFPEQCNNFAALILKPELPGDLHPWIQWRDGKAIVNKEWLEQTYQ
ncbi:MAG: class I SAM-dependent methyltransferase [Planctomycetota bacterium]